MIGLPGTCDMLSDGDSVPLEVFEHGVHSSGRKQIVPDSPPVPHSVRQAQVVAKSKFEVFESVFADKLRHSRAAGLEAGPRE